MKPFLFLALVVSLLVAGCGSSSSESTASSNGSATYKPSKLRIALVPSDDTEQMVNQFEKLRTFISDEIKMPVEVVKVTSYAAVIEAMKGKKVDIAWFGPASYIVAEDVAKAEPIAVAVDSKGQASYFSEVLVPAKSSITDLKQLEGKKLAFVEASSTSGCLVPSFLFLKAVGKPADKFCAVSYVGSHDTVVNMVKNGSIDAGATNNLTVNRMLAQHKLSESDFKVVAKSEDLPASPLCCRSDLDPTIKDAFWKALEKSSAKLGTYEIAGLGEIASFKQVKPADFQLIRDIRSQLKVSNDTLLK